MLDSFRIKWIRESAIKIAEDTSLAVTPSAASPPAGADNIATDQDDAENLNPPLKRLKPSGKYLILDKVGKGEAKHWMIGMAETLARRFSEMRTKEAESQTEPTFDVEAYIVELNGSSGNFDKRTSRRT